MIFLTTEADEDIEAVIEASRLDSVEIRDIDETNSNWDIFDDIEDRREVSKSIIARLIQRRVERRRRLSRLSKSHEAEKYNLPND